MCRTQGAHKSAQNDEEVVNDEEERVVVEDADISTASPPAKNRRKKSQAFGVPKTAALKAKIDRNVAESPLLRLPREVRTRIWVLVIGNRLLHIRILCQVHPDVDHCHCNPTVSKEVWTTSCCLLLDSEQDFFRRSKVPVKELVMQDERDYGSYLDANASHQISPCPADRIEIRTLHLQRAPHYQCHYELQRIRSGKPNYLDGVALKRYRAGEHVVQVQILRVCRQVYIEANPIFWSSNTLAFVNPSHFAMFMSERIAAQKASITRLLLDFSWSACGSPKSGQARRATSNGIITTLSGLRTLHLYIQDEEYGKNDPGAGNSDDKQEIEDWQSSTKFHEARDGFTNFKRLPLQDVTVLMLGKPEWLYSMQHWRHAERIKYAEAVRNTILDPEGSQKLQKEQANASAARKAELLQRKLTSRPCAKFSTEQECAEAKQEQIDDLRIAKGWSGSPRRRAQACKFEHVCLLCLLTLERTRQEARQCQKPGRCVEAYFSIMVKNSDSPEKSMNIFVQPEDTVSTILDRYVRISGICKYFSYDVQLEGVVLKPEATVQDVDLKKDGKMEVAVAITDSSDIRGAD